MLKVLSELWDPSWDIVRRNGVDDPAGGILDRAPDRFTLFRRYRDNRANKVGRAAVIAKTAGKNEIEADREDEPRPVR
jgi:hypothetical protein